MPLLDIDNSSEGPDILEMRRKMLDRIGNRIQDLQPLENVQLTVTDLFQEEMERLERGKRFELVVFGTEMIEGLAKNYLLAAELHKQKSRFSDGVDQILLPGVIVVTDDELKIEWHLDLDQNCDLGGRSEYRIRLCALAEFDGQVERGLNMGSPTELFTP